MAGNNNKVRLQSTESPYFYTTYKNPRNQDKLELKKYDPRLNKHVKFVEKKIKK